MSNFWKLLPKPFFALAPMEDVTDVVFREIVATQLAKPDVYFTEFTNADGLFSKGREATIRRLKFTQNQTPIVAQIWGSDPQYLFKAAELVADMNFDGVDINMGCPVRDVMKKGAGAALCTNFALTKAIIGEVKRGAKGIPVSVKTRIGFDKIITNEWVSFLLEQKIDALSIHGRTAKQMSQGDANWEEIGKAVEIKNKISPETLIIGNGDIKTYSQGKEMVNKYKVDGIMIGRGIFSNPWIFEKNTPVKNHGREECLRIMIKHLELFETTWGDTKNFEIMKKFFKIYIKDFDGANLLRQRLMNCKSASEIKHITKELDLI